MAMSKMPPCDNNYKFIYEHMYLSKGKDTMTYVSFNNSQSNLIYSNALCLQCLK